MSRFLDAMRDKAILKGADDSARAYQGKIVDANDVLSPRVDGDPPVDGPEELSIQPLGGDGEATPSSMHDTAAADDVVESGNATVQHEQAIPLRQEPASRSVAGDTKTALQNQVNTATSSVSSSMNTAGDQQPAVNKSAFSVRSLDPLFYLIVGIAAVGLFACLYALITQNDAYFEREYQQLQKESAALQARLAASTRLEAALTAAASAQSPTPALTSTAVAEPEPSTGQEATVTEFVSVPQLVNGEIQAQGVSAVEVVKPDVEIVAPEDSVEVEESDPEQAQQQVAVAAEPATESALVLLRQELESLRMAMTSQDEKISRLEQDNLELTSIVSNSKNEIKPATQDIAQPASQSVSQVESQVSLPTDKAQLSGTSEAPMIASQPAVSASVIESPLLETPLGGTETEITDWVQQGYFAYQAQDFTAASGFYGKALEFDPYDRDANLGVAATAQAVGDFKLAEDRYRHLLTLDPADEVAFSALLNLSGSGDHGATIELELTQHAVYVDNPQKLYAILGNYYSQQRRWINAESAYVIALGGSEDNPDFLFNYAVTLDNIGRTAQAAEYYSQALVGMEGATHSFDAKAARQRLQSLLSGER